jgi:hypothetical protein
MRIGKAIWGLKDNTLYNSFNYTHLESIGSGCFGVQNCGSVMLGLRGRGSINGTRLGTQSGNYVLPHSLTQAPPGFPQTPCCGSEHSNGVTYFLSF